MIDGLGPYPAYKDAGAPWIGRVPHDWDVLRARNLMREVDVRSKTGAETHLSMSQRLGLVPSAEMNERHLVSESYVGAKLCEVNDLVLNRLKAHLGVFARASQPGLVSPDYTVLRRVSDSVSIAFLEYVLKSWPCRTELRTRAKGLVEGFWRLYTDDFYQIKLPAPPISEQNAIVRFLNYEDRQIRRYVRAKKKLIGLLNEQRQKAIHRAMTTGIDPGVDLRSSGVEWLGDIPHHWEVKRLKWAVRLQRGYDLPSERRLPGAYPVVSSGGEIGFHSEFRSRGPGVVMGRYGSTDAVFYVESDFWPHNTALFVTDFQGNRPRWCYFLLRTISKADHSGKSAVPGVDRKDLYEIEVAVPPASEQDAIVTWIEATIAIADRAIARMEQEVTLLRDYRNRLIADVVTGKLDVREAAARLPDHLEDSDHAGFEDVAIEDEGGDLSELGTVEEEAEA